MAENHFIKFLSAYGPSSNSNNMYDEFVVEASNIANIDPLAIPENYSEDIFKKLLSNEAFSIILTGTAGDGKTYTARQVLNLMNQNFNKSETWSNNQSVFDFSLADRKITFIKDMSEMSVSQKQEHIPKIIDSFTQKNPNNLYVICVNDGQLLKIWRDHIDFLKKQNDSPYNLINQTQQLLNDIQDLLKDDAKSHPRYSFELINMSCKIRG
jgi:Cdc6-like AAA superfamily ATPase